MHLHHIIEPKGLIYHVLCVYQLSLLQKKLLAELPKDALIVAGRFPFPDWTACKVEGEGADRAWAYHIQELRQHYQSQDTSVY